MHIGDRKIGGAQRPYIIAEIGVNHDGSIDRALELTRSAAAAGADAIKLQLFRADLLMSGASQLANYQASAGESDPISMLRRLELSAEQMSPVVALAHKLGIHAIVTVFSLELVPEAEKLPWDAYKTASPDIIHKPLLDALGATGRPLILSTGASTIDEVARAAGWISGAADRLAVLQCVSSYPTPMAQAELGGIVALRNVLPLPVGYSDHTREVETASAAAALGAVILEKHFTYDVKAKGPDHAASLTADGLRRYVLAAARTQAAPEVEPLKRVLDIEKDVRKVSRQSIVTTKVLPPGHKIERSDIVFKRPGTGFAPFELDRVLGSRTSRLVEADRPISTGDLA